MHVAFAGGVGGAKLAAGLADLLAPDGLLVVVNTGDDFSHLGLRICPDLDTVLYTLAGVANPDTGWGIRGETWRFMRETADAGGETWFRIGDRDLETHRARTAALAAGRTPSEAAAELARRLGVRHRVVPASDDEIATVVLSGGERIAFQDYFVRLRCEPRVTGFEFSGASAAEPSPAVRDAFAGGAVRSVILCPSNPFVSIGPILAVPAIRGFLERRSFPVIAVSPIVGGRAVKGPAAKMMAELGLPVTAAAVAAHYGELLDVMIVDEVDRAAVPSITSLGRRAHVAATVMRTPSDRLRLAAEAVALADGRRR